MVTITPQITEQQKEFINGQIQETGIKQAELVRRAIDHYRLFVESTTAKKAEQ